MYRRVLYMKIIERRVAKLEERTLHSLNLDSRTDEELEARLIELDQIILYSLTGEDRSLMEQAIVARKAQQWDRSLAALERLRSK